MQVWKFCFHLWHHINLRRGSFCDIRGGLISGLCLPAEVTWCSLKIQENAVGVSGLASRVATSVEMLGRGFRTTWKALQRVGGEDKYAKCTYPIWWTVFEGKCFNSFQHSLTAHFPDSRAEVSEQEIAGLEQEALQHCCLCKPGEWVLMWEYTE